MFTDRIGENDDDDEDEGISIDPVDALRIILKVLGTKLFFTTTGLSSC